MCYLFLRKTEIPFPYSFTNTELLSDMGGQDLVNIITKVSDLLPQFSEFIQQFNNIILNCPINVITDSDGSLSIDVPSSMPNDEAEKLSRRIGIIDRLITTRSEEIDNLLKKGLEIETKIKLQDPNFSSKILPKIAEFNKLNEQYRH